VLIAPELDGLLLQYARLSEQLNAKLASPPADWIELTSDKTATCNRWMDRNVPTPWGRLWSGRANDVADWPLPLVEKRNDGAGSEGIRRIDAIGDLPPGPTALPLRIERLCPGLPASVAVINGREGRVFLPACGQRLSGDGRFRYLGGWLLVDPWLQCRATRLARRAIEALPPVCGYVGVDIILGPDRAGTQDVAVEVNPRLTTSYIGLRQATSTNLAQLWLDMVRGIPGTLPAFHSASVHFVPGGLAG
jgi:predicted ATP-grasp superfamily ATP-dependent carboligase